MGIYSKETAEIALIQLGPAVDALAEGNLEALTMARVADQQGEDILVEEAIERLRKGLLDACLRLCNYRAKQFTKQLESEVV